MFFVPFNHINSSGEEPVIHRRRVGEISVIHIKLSGSIFGTAILHLKAYVCIV